MNRALATSLTTATFLIIGISGVMLFFHFFDSQVKALHEWLGFAFIAAVVFHLFYNWKSMKSYFNKKAFTLSMLLGLAVTASFVGLSQQEGPSPKRVVFESIMKAPLEKSFALFNIEKQTALTKLTSAKINYNNEKSIGAIAKANQTSPFKIISILTK